MNKKTLSLAFVSAALFFGCSADSFYGPNAPKELSSGSSMPLLPSLPSSSSGGASGSWCVNHYWEDCTNYPAALTSDAACKTYWSYGYESQTYLMSYCPSGYSANAN